MTFERLLRAEFAVELIILDLCDRRGLKWEWNGIPPDVQGQIKRVWKELILSAMSDSRESLPEDFSTRWQIVKDARS